MFTAKTPKDIEKYSIDDIAKLLPITEGLPSARVRLNLIKMLFTVLGYDLTPDLALALCAEPRAQLMIALAGGGKTTCTQIKVLVEKIIRNSKLHPDRKLSGDKVLCLVYNKHNVKPMEDTHRQMVSRLNIAGIKGLNIDPLINASTMHSFCDQIRKENVARIGLMGYKLLKDDEIIRLFEMIAGRVFKKRGVNVQVKVNGKDLAALYALAKESMVDVAELRENDKFTDVNLPIPVLEDIFTFYESMKVTKKSYDFTDLLCKVYKLLTENSEVLRNTQRFFDYVVADEIQDFTPIMMSLLQVLVSDGTPLVCIGDDDQSVYKFRGADIYNTLDFENKFDGGEVYLLSRNRRCAAAILDYARFVLEENTLRFEKDMIGVRPGGKIDFVPYNSIEGENISVVNDIKSLSEEERYDSVVCYRERESSILLSEMLEDAKIQFYTIGGHPAFSHELYRHIVSVLDLLESPMGEYNQLNLYKVLPVKKSDVFAAMNYDSKSGRFTKDITRKHFSKIDFGSAMGTRGFADAMEELTRLSTLIKNRPLSEFFPDVYKLLCRYFWKFQKSIKGLDPAIDDYVEKKVFKLFNVDTPYTFAYKSYSKRKDVCSKNQTSKSGITVSTFHSLKGLERKNCYIIDMDNSMFPNFSRIESRGYSTEVTTSLKECENRLYYVAVTRAKDYLKIYYAKNNPSKYVTDWLNGRTTPEEGVQKAYAQRDLSAQEMVEAMCSDFSNIPGYTFAEEPVVQKQSPVTADQANLKQMDFDAFDPFADDSFSTAVKSIADVDPFDVKQCATSEASSKLAGAASGSFMSSLIGNL